MVSLIAGSGKSIQRIHYLRLAWKAVSELGIAPIASYGLYKLCLKSGFYRRLTPRHEVSFTSNGSHWMLHTDLIPLPDRQRLEKNYPATALFAEADEILSGTVRLFGKHTEPLVLSVHDPLMHWTKSVETDNDIKHIWEPARFGWAIILARAYHRSNNEDYARFFWRNTLAFLQSNPVNMGPHWISAQEVGLRLIALVFSIQVFAHSIHSTPQNIALLAQSIADHAERIPPTIIYARSQNNNHLISEAAGLYTAAAALPNHPRAPYWKRLGKKWLNYAFQSQIATDGTYIQHSTNYHRLMLQLGLWVNAVQRHAFPAEPFASTTLLRLAAATRWLWKLLDPISGFVPNLGPNDGAYVMPLSACSFNDYRPVVSSATKAFLHRSMLASGDWDEMSEWYQLENPSPSLNELDDHSTMPPHILKSRDTWAYLRAAQFSSRPGHADQLHVDLWWRGINIAQDAGTYRYTAPYPWNNSLTHTAVHNTLMINGEEQMHRVGRFLYLEWAQAKPPSYECAADGSWEKLTSSHDGYRHLGITHQRSLTVDAHQTWRIIDIVTGPVDDQVHEARLHWLLPNWEYQIDERNLTQSVGIRLRSPQGWISLKIECKDSQGSNLPQVFKWGLALAGELLRGAGPILPTWGWISPTYNEKTPALSFFVTLRAALPIYIQSQWDFPN